MVHCALRAASVRKCCSIPLAESLLLMAWSTRCSTICVHPEFGVSAELPIDG
jgi:hypothetical protein